MCLARKVSETRVAAHPAYLYLVRRELIDRNRNGGNAESANVVAHRED